MDFGETLKALKSGEKVAREGWNGKGMWLVLITEWATAVDGVPLLPLSPFIGMKTADDKLVPWLASQTDVLADDWYVEV